MPKTPLAAVVAVASLAAAPAAAAPTVAVDILPVHSLVARVMQGVGDPSLIVRPGASPHGYSMRPSEAASLERADVVFWVGEDLTPWLGRALSSLATDAAVVELIEVDGVERLGFREGATFEAHDHGHEHDHHDAHDDGHDHAHGEDHAHDDHAHDDHAHDDHAHDDHAHDDHAHDDHAHDDHAHDDHAHDDHAHAHDGVDPHAWLDPVNAQVWLGAIASALSEADPGNAALYARNAEEGKAELDALIDEIAGDLAPVEGRDFVVFHDAYHYFEHRFGIEAAGAIAVSDAAPPSPARVAEIRAAIEGMDAVCVFAEPQFEPDLVDTVTEGTGARTGVLDPVGVALEPGPALYPSLLRNLADSLVGCLAD